MALAMLALAISGAHRKGKLGREVVALSQYLNHHTVSSDIETLGEETGDPPIPKQEKPRISELQGDGHEQPTQVDVRRSILRRLWPFGRTNGNGNGNGEAH